MSFLACSKSGQSMGSSDTNVMESVLGTTPAEQSSDPAQSGTPTRASDPVVVEPKGSAPSVVGDYVNAISGESSSSQNGGDSEDISSSSESQISSSAANSSASAATTESCDTKMSFGDMTVETCYSGYPVGYCATMAEQVSGTTAKVVTACPSGATAICPTTGTDLTTYYYSSSITSCPKMTQ